MGHFHLVFSKILPSPLGSKNRRGGRNSPAGPGDSALPLCPMTKGGRNSPFSFKKTGDSARKMGFRILEVFVLCAGINPANYQMLLEIKQFFWRYRAYYKNRGNLPLCCQWFSKLFSN